MSAKAALDLTPYRECRLCPRDCGVDRTEGKACYCGETSTCRLGWIGPHFGEEPCFTGKRGSGTVFFSGCASCCIFCQNYQISMEGLGQEYSPEQLVEAAMDLARAGVHNINFVTPDHFWPHVEFVCRRLREDGVTIPFLFNCSGFQREDLIPAYAEHIDLFMPDFKYADPELSRLCIGDLSYCGVATRAVRKMIEIKGFLEPWDPTGEHTAVRGVLVRHLVLPDHVDNSLQVVRLLHDEFGPELPVSIMGQFQPIPEAEVHGELMRALRPDEFEQVRNLVEELGFQRAFVQEGGDSEGFLPDFAREQPFRGNEGGRGNG